MFTPHLAAVFSKDRHTVSTAASLHCKVRVCTLNSDSDLARELAAHELLPILEMGTEPLGFRVAANSC